jgi:uncharacterized membrane protein
MVVGFPIALFTATLACLLVYIGTHDTFYYRAAMVASLSGVTMAALAAIPGAIDLLSLPTGSRARRVGIKHGSYALATVGMFAIAAAVLYRNWAFKTMIDGEWQLDATVPLAIATVGMVAVVIVGSLGWTLVQTHHVGIKPALVHAHRPSREPELEPYAASPQPS